MIRDVPFRIFHALFMGPIFVLASMEENGEREITDEVLSWTFDGVARAVFRPEVLEGDAVGGPGHG